MAEQSLDPVVLPGWPTSTTNNLSWSEEHLAVAAGEVIHMLTPRLQPTSSTLGSGTWHVETIRVNQFTEQEWPLFELATLKDMAIGEEQSQSPICGLAWSPFGVGVHRRAVLAVLTTNLLLSLWESNGTPKSWRRTCVVNHHLNQTARTKLRVRAFAWLPVLHLNEHDRRGQQYLVTVDDDDTVSVFYIRKIKSSVLGGWDISIVHKFDLPRDLSSPTNGTSLLQRALRASPITQIECREWQNTNRTDTSFRLNLSFRRGGTGPPCPDLVLTCELREGELQFEGQTTTMLSSKIPSASMTLSKELEVALAKPKSEFDNHFDLQGHVRTRLRGTTKSPDGTVSAVCVSFHPSDMIEYNVPSTERTTVVFARNQGADLQSSQPNNKDPRLQLLQWIAAHADVKKIKTRVDATIVQVAAACIESTYSTEIALMEWSEAAKELAANLKPATSADEDGDANMEREYQFLTNTVPEPCDMCQAAINLGQDLSSGTCSNGHIFARCGISFLSIQEPGISKYCSRCGRQFLNILKLEPHGGPSFGTSLFEEFDQCPYCHGKFRD